MIQEMMPKSSFHVTMLLQLLLVMMSTPICLSTTNLRTGGFELVKIRDEVMNKNYGALPPDFVAKFYTETLDHFNYKPEGYTTFQQGYIVNYNYWGGADTSSPIFMYTGDEASTDAVVSGAGFVVDLASRFNGPSLYIELSGLCSIDKVFDL